MGQVCLDAFVHLCGQKPCSCVWPLRLSPSRWRSSRLNQEEQDCVPPSPASGLPRFPVWQTQVLSSSAGRPQPLAASSQDPEHLPVMTSSASTGMEPRPWLPKPVQLKSEHGFLMSATWENGDVGSSCLSSPLLHGHFQVQTRSSLLPLSCGHHIWGWGRE